MRTIEINTTQHVTIEHELASVRDRITAYIIDAIIIWSSILILVLLFSVAMPQWLTRYTFYLVVVPVFLFYSLISEIMANGRSWGKRALGIKVVKINGKEGTASDYLIRWTFRMVDIYFSIGSIATLLISSTEKAQRLGDVIANTAVIKVKPKNNLRLNDIMRINSLQNYVPRYPEVRQMSEAEMLLLKNTLDRFKQYPNNAHQHALVELTRALRQRLNISEEISNPVNFVRGLINDYIVLTR